MTTPVTKPEGPTHPAPTHPPRTSTLTMPTPYDPQPPPPIPKPPSGVGPFVALGLGAGLLLAAVGALWLMWGAA